MKQLPLRIGTAQAPTLDNFEPGANGALLAALREPLGSATTLYLWGPAGVGKTHLLRALAAASRARGDTALVVDANTTPPRDWPESVSLVLIDDCDALDAARQHAAFALYVESAGAGVPVLAAGRLPPVDLPVREDLRTRLASGPVFRVHALGEAETRRVMVRESGRRGITLSDEVVDYLMTRFSRDLGSLMTLLDALDAFALAEKRAVTVPLIKRMVAEQAPGACAA